MLFLAQKENPDVVYRSFINKRGKKKAYSFMTGAKYTERTGLNKGLTEAEEGGEQSLVLMP